MSAEHPAHSGRRIDATRRSAVPGNHPRVPGNGPAGASRRSRVFRAALSALLLTAGLLSGTAVRGEILDCEMDLDPLDFGTLDRLFESTAEIATQIRLRCRNHPTQGGGAYRIEFGAGLDRRGLAGFRTLVGSHPGLSYNLYLDPTRVHVLGDGTGGTAVIQGHTGDQAFYETTHFVYGRLFATAAYRPTHYHDRILVQLLF